MLVDVQQNQNDFEFSTVQLVLYSQIATQLAI